MALNLPFLMRHSACCWFEWASLEGASEPYTFQESRYYHTPQIYFEVYSVRLSRLTP